MVSLIGSSLQGVGHSFSFFPSRRRCLYRQPVRFGVTYVDRMARMPLDILWSNSGDYRRTMAERTVFSPVTLGWSFRPFLCWYLGSVSPVLFPLYLQCVSDQVLFFLCLLFCHKNAQLNCYSFQEVKDREKRKEGSFFCFQTLWLSLRYILLTANFGDFRQPHCKIKNKRMWYYFPSNDTVK